MEHYEPGTFSWVDLMARDRDKARDFYTRLFDWEAEVQNDGGGSSYVMFKKEGQPVAGLGQMPQHLIREEMPNLWNSYVTVSDVDDAVRAARANGGDVVQSPVDIPSAGRMAIITDPEGANLSLWQPQGHMGAGLVNVPGSFCWNELACRDVEKTQLFYETLFGWKFEKNEQTSAEYSVIKNKGRENGGLIRMTSQWGETPAHWSVYFAVEDLPARLESLKDIGGRLGVGPFDTAFGKVAMAEDDQHGHFYLIQRKA